MVALAVVASAGCVTRPPPPTLNGVANISRQASLVLPRPPAYPDRRTISQTVIADLHGRRSAFEAVVELSPDLVTMTILAPSGPRLAQVRWSAEGVTALDMAGLPTGLRSENLMADLFMTLWPRTAVEAALGPTSDVRDLPNGAGRSIRVGGKPLVEIHTIRYGDGGARTTVHNLDLGYTLTVLNQPPE